MKRVGIVVFVIALAIGLAVSSLFSVGKTTSKVFNFSFGAKGTRGSGNVSSEKRDLTDFNAIDVGGAFEVEIVAQQDFSVEVSADDNLLPSIRTTVESGVLKIETDGRISPTKPVHISISAPDINAMDISGVAAVTATGMKNAQTSVDLSGKSTLNISGQTDKFVVEISGASHLDADQLSAVDAVIDASGASRATVNLTGDLRADASGASSIIYSGTPGDVEKSSSGAASISRKD